MTRAELFIAHLPVATLAGLLGNPRAMRAALEAFCYTA